MISTIVTIQPRQAIFWRATACCRRVSTNYWQACLKNSTLLILSLCLFSTPLFSTPSFALNRAPQPAVELHLEILERYQRGAQPRLPTSSAPQALPPQEYAPQPMPSNIPVTPTLQRENISTTTLPGSSDKPIAARPPLAPLPPMPAPYTAVPSPSAPPAPLQQAIPPSAPDSAYVPPALPELERELPAMLAQPSAPYAAAPVYAPAPPRAPAYTPPPPQAPAPVLTAPYEPEPAPTPSHPAYPQATTGSRTTSTQTTTGRSYLPPSRYEARQAMAMRSESAPYAFSSPTPSSMPFSGPTPAPKNTDSGFTVEVIQPEPRHIPPAPPKKKKKAAEKKKEEIPASSSDTPAASEIEKSVAKALKEEAAPAIPDATPATPAKADDLFADLPLAPTETPKEAPKKPEPKTVTAAKETPKMPELPVATTAKTPTMPDLPPLPSTDAAPPEIPSMPEMGTPKTVTVPKDTTKPTVAPAIPKDVDLSFLEDAPDLSSPPRPTGNGSSSIKLSLPFSPTGTAIAGPMEGKLTALATELKEASSSRITIIAYASGGDDTSGGARRTSLSRAVAVRNYLKGQGIADDRMATQAKGDQGGKDQPDRVDIVVQ